MNKNKGIKGASPATGLKQALVVLSGVSVVGLGLAAQAAAQSGAPMTPATAATKVDLKVVNKPKNVLVKTPQKWKRVVIELTPEQKAQLAKAGVQTDQLKITTYNIERLAGDMVN